MRLKETQHKNNSDKFFRNIIYTNLQKKRPDTTIRKLFLQRNGRQRYITESLLSGLKHLQVTMLYYTVCV